LAVISSSRRLTILVLCANGSMLAINAISSMYIARHLDVYSFAEYSTMVSFATVVGVSLRGLQFLMLDDYADYKPHSITTREIHGPRTVFVFLIKLGLFLAVMSPLIAEMLDVSIDLVFIGILIVLSFGLQSSASGKYLGLGKSGRLQIILVIGTCVQLPLLFIGGLWSIGTSFFLSVLIVPSILIWVAVECSVKNLEVRENQITWRNIIETGFNLGVVAFSTNTYLLLAGGVFQGNERGALSGLAIILTTVTGLAVSMSTLLSRQTSVSRRSTGSLSKLHNVEKYILFSSVIPISGFLIVVLNQAPLKWIFGLEFSGVLADSTLILATLSFSPWGFVTIALFDRGSAYSINKFMPISIATVMNGFLLLIFAQDPTTFFTINGSLGLLAAFLVISIDV
jgi:hypothetical protein